MTRTWQSDSSCDRLIFSQNSDCLSYLAVETCCFCFLIDLVMFSVCSFAIIPPLFWKAKRKRRVCLQPVGILLRSRRHRHKSLIFLWGSVSKIYNRKKMVSQMFISSVSRIQGCEGGNGAITISLFLQQGTGWKITAASESFGTKWHSSVSLCNSLSARPCPPHNLF